MKKLGIGFSGVGVFFRKLEKSVGLGAERVGVVVSQN